MGGTMQPNETLNCEGVSDKCLEDTTVTHALNGIQERGLFKSRQDDERAPDGERLQQKHGEAENVAERQDAKHNVL